MNEQIIVNYHFGSSEKEATDIETKPAIPLEEIKSNSRQPHQNNVLFKTIGRYNA